MSFANTEDRKAYMRKWHQEHREKAAYPPEYEIWKGMKRRCENPNHRSYDDYGGRGIKVCERWQNDFRADIGPRPSSEHTLDRWPDACAC